MIPNNRFFLLLGALLLSWRLAGGAALSGESVHPPEPAEQDLITIDAAVAESLEGNLELRAEETRIGIAEAAIVSARLRPNPTLSIAADHLDLLGTGFTEINGGGPAEVSAAAEFLWERGGKRIKRSELAITERQMVFWEVEDFKRRLVLLTRNAFVDLLQAQESARLASDDLNWMKRIFEINQARLASGDLAEVEVKRTQIALLQSQNEMRLAESRVSRARNQLGVVLGRKARVRNLVAEGDFKNDQRELDRESLIGAAYRQRPDLRAPPRKKPGRTPT